MTRHSERNQPVRAVAYDIVASDLWRWVEAAQDEPVRRFAAEFAGLDREHRERLRERLSEPDFQALLTYGQRSALAALRTGDVRHVVSAFDALSAVNLDQVSDDRDVGMVAALLTYAGRRVDGQLAQLVAPAVARAEPDLAELLTEVLSEPIDLAVDCGYREADTPARRVLLGDEGEPFQPQADLVTPRTRWPACWGRTGTTSTRSASITGCTRCGWAGPATRRRSPRRSG